MTSAIPVQFSTNQAIKPPGSWSHCEFVQPILTPELTIIVNWQFPLNYRLLVIQNTHSLTGILGNEHILLKNKPKCLDAGLEPGIARFVILSSNH